MFSSSVSVGHEALFSIKTIQCLEFSQQAKVTFSRVFFSDEVLDLILPKIAKADKMCHFILDRCDLSLENLEFLLRAVIKVPCLRRLEIEMSDLTNVCLILKKIFADTSTKFCSLHLGKNMSTKCLEILCEGLKTNKSIKYLHFPNLSQTVENISLLDDLLLENTVIETVYMDVVSESGFNVIQRIKATQHSSKRLMIEISGERIVDCERYAGRRPFYES